MVEFHFAKHVDIKEVRDTFRLSFLAIESLHGQVKCDLFVSMKPDEKARTIAIDVSNQVGQDLATIFLGFVSREFGEDSVWMESPPTARK